MKTRNEIKNELITEKMLQLYPDGIRKVKHMFEDIYEICYNGRDYAIICSKGKFEITEKDIQHRLRQEKINCVIEQLGI